MNVSNFGIPIFGINIHRCKNVLRLIRTFKNISYDGSINFVFAYHKNVGVLSLATIKNVQI
jgi:hypothetical protein